MLLAYTVFSVMGDLGLSLVKLAKYEDEEGSKCGQYSELGVGARSVAADARRLGLAAVRHSRLARAANSQAMEALEPLHDELAMSPVGAWGGEAWRTGQGRRGSAGHAGAQSAGLRCAEKIVALVGCFASGRGAAAVRAQVWL